MTSASESVLANLGGPSTGTVDVGSSRVTYYDSVAEHPGRVPLVLVHGTGGSTALHFRFLFPMLATAQRVIAIDLDTPAGVLPEEGPARYAEQVAAVVEQVVPGRPVALAGYSLGAVVVTAVAGTRPELVDKLVLMAGWLKTTRGQLLRNEVWLALHKTGDFDTLGRYMTYCAFSDVFLRLRTSAEVERIVAGVATGDATRAQMEMNRTVDLTHLAPRVECPTLIVAGTDDQMTPRRQAKALFGAIRDARYTEVTAGHAMVVERASELVHLLSSFNEAPDRHPAGSVLPARRP
ncbi:alpha/beta hydrolase [Streptomyces sp. NPDC004237]|uniref:alpha/beta fold hydrolase n=1 Tax=Streptomyces sp. NPDC004237 TaxID=3154455 RepID=UPI00339E3895